jgi:subtilisin family serine protease
MKLLNSLIVATSLSLLSINANAQYEVAPGKYAVKLTDKNNSPYSINNPEKFLSQKSIDRRKKFNIKIDETDLPINPQYLDSLTKMGFKIDAKSKWLNCVVLKTKIEKIDKLKNVSFVDLNYNFRAAKPKAAAQKQTLKMPDTSGISTKATHKPIDYGYSQKQVTMIKTDVLHEMGYRGEGMKAAIIDGGFKKARKVQVMNKAFYENRVPEIWNFVTDKSNVFTDDWHGTAVMSCMASNAEGWLVGTSPEAEFYLYNSEDGGSEYEIEEFNWAEAAERADSIGVDLINSSLGYNEFDKKLHNHTHEELNGEIGISTQAADIAASRGIVVVLAAGNEGDEEWKKISCPADADNCLSVGAVMSFKGIEPAFFSSFGPTADGRIKPDVCAEGYMAYCSKDKKTINAYPGTSFASPIVAGSTLCLMQAHPNANPETIINAIHLSSNHYNNPTDQWGYGLGNFELAHKILTAWGF